MQKSVSEMARTIKALIPSDTLDGYTLKPVLKSIADEKRIRKGVLAFKEFLINLYGRLIAEGGLYDPPPKQPKNDDSVHDNAVSLAVGCPFINNVTSILINIGYYGDLTGNGDSMEFGNWKSLTSAVGPQGGPAKQTISAPKIIEVLRFLSSCGLSINGIDLDGKKIDLAKLDVTKIVYPDDPAMLTGLKVMAFAHNDLSTKNDYYIFQRCDDRSLRNEPPDSAGYLKGYVQSLSGNLQDYILKLHQHYIDEGLTCKMKTHYFGVIFSYLYKSTVVWECIPSPDGCFIVTKAHHMSEYADEIKNFHPLLREKISKGYGCEKKRFGEPCQKGCHGFSFPLNDTILDIGQDIEKWLDKELSCIKG